MTDDQRNKISCNSNSLQEVRPVSKQDQRKMRYAPAAGADYLREHGWNNG